MEIKGNFKVFVSEAKVILRYYPRLLLILWFFTLVSFVLFPFAAMNLFNP